MSMKQIMRWGHDFPKDKEGGIFNLWGQWGKAKCQWENPSNNQLPFLYHSPQSFNSARNWLKQLLHGDGKSMGKEIQIWGNTHFWEKRF